MDLKTKKCFQSFFFLGLIFLSLLSYSQTRFDYANWRGFYVGAQIGYSVTHYQNYQFIIPMTIHSVSDRGPGSSFHVGYNFNRYFAAEMGAAYLHKTIFHEYIRAPFGFDNARIKNNIVYFAAKFSIPLPDAIRIFAKLGGGYVVRDRIIYWEQLIMSGGEITRPVYGAGINWRPSPHWELELAWLRTAKLASQRLPPQDFLGIGAQYLF